MTTELGTELGTTLGTALGAMEDQGSAPFDTSKLYALRLPSQITTTTYTTQPGGGEVGVGTGFGTFSLVYMVTPPAATRLYTNSTSAATAGHQARFSSAGLLQAAISDGTVMRTSGVQQFYSTDGAKIQCIVTLYDGAPKVYMPRLGRTTGPAYTFVPDPTAASTLFGTASGNEATGSGGTQNPLWFIARAAFRGTPSDAQLQDACDLIRTTQDMPSKAALEAVMPGTTITHRWSLRDVLLAASVPVADNSNAGTTIADSVTNAPGDAYVRAGATPSTIRVIDPATPRLWAYETTPVVRGAGTLTSANYFESSFDDASDAAGFWWAMLLHMPAATQAANTIAGAASGNTGFDVRPGANNATLGWFLGDGSAYSASGNAVMQTAKINMVVGVWDAPNLRQRTYGNRVEVGTGIVRTAYVPATATKLGLGRSPRDPSAAGGARALLGYAQGNGVPSLAQVQALFDAVAANESMQPIAGMTSVLVDLTGAIAGAGGSIPASIANTGTLGGSFARTGAPAANSVYARAFAW